MSDIQDPELIWAIEALGAVRKQAAEIIRGQDGALDFMLTVLVAGWHALLEGVPGTGKTLAVRTLAATLNCRSKRIAFTPDLMPSDITGTTILTPGEKDFHLHQGPIFTDLLLADEINRAPAKTQSALLEAMAEKHVTIDGQRHLLSPVFTIFATQNPVEFEGTYPLPEAQQDRFLLKIKLDYPDAEAERFILERTHTGAPLDKLEQAEIKPLLDIPALQRAQAALPGIRVDPPILKYILDIVRATRRDESILLGGGPRASIALLVCAKAWAMLHERDFVSPDDVVRMVEPVLHHRITLSADAEVAGAIKSEVIARILEKLEVPR